MIKCKLCPDAFESMRALKTHNKSMHLDYFSQVQAVYENDCYKVATYKRLAADGMRGLSDGSGVYNKDLEDKSELGSSDDEIVPQADSVLTQSKGRNHNKANEPLLEPSILEALFGATHDFELALDLKKALSLFSPLERRILGRVLLQGQSVKEATKDTKRSQDGWERWLYGSALPRLREVLAVYKDSITTTEVTKRDGVHRQKPLPWPNEKLYN